MQNKGFPSEFLEELKRKADLVSVVSNYVKLEQKGNRFWGCCPFHNEKTPSFTVSQDGLYYCFGCKEYGDVIKFVQKLENVEFYDAVKILAEKVGMQLPEYQSSQENVQRKKTKERLLLALDYAYKHYVSNLYEKDAKVAQEYIKKRKFTRRELEDFKIGYAKDWNDMPNYLLSKGFTPYELLSAGICNKNKSGKLYDVLAGRLVFPIFNAMNECIGFSARVLEKTDYGKYLNTAETPVFQKGKVVFAINILKAQYQQKLVDKVIIVEGQMDVIAMHKSGFKSTVACMGTALTKDHVKILKRFSENIVLCFDGDGAGTKATLKAIEMFRDENVNLKIAKLSGGKDPDEILNNYGRDYLENLINNAQGYMEFLIDYHKSKFDLSDAVGRGRFVKVVLAEIRKLGSPTLFEPYLEMVRDLTQVPLDILRRDINAEAVQPKITISEPKPAAVVENGDEKAVKNLLAAILHKKPYVDKRVDFGKLLSGYAKYLDLISQNVPMSSLLDSEDEKENAFLIDLINYNFAEMANDEEKYYKECLWKVAEQKLKEFQGQLNKEYRECEDLTRRAEIAGKLGKIAIQLKNKSMEEFNGRRES